MRPHRWWSGVLLLGLAWPLSAAPRKRVPASVPVPVAAAPVDEERQSSSKDSDESLWERPHPEAPKAPPETAPSLPRAADSRATSPVRISGVLFDGRRKGTPEPDECIRLTNPSDEVVEIGGFRLSDRYGPPRNPVAPAHSDSNAPRDIVFPLGTRLKPGADIWVAYDGEAFTETFGHRPDFEARGKVPGLPTVAVDPDWPTWSAVHGVVSLHDASGQTIDLVPYERSHHGDALEKREIPRNLWTGPSVMLFHASPFGWTGQVLARDRDAAGRVLPDTDSADDWDSGFSRNALGRDPIHRVEFPGQSRFVFPRIDDPNAEILAASAPENAFAALKGALEAARKEILVRIYQFENDHIADLLVEARQRGVSVTVFCEGSPVGGLPDQERYIVERLHAAGIPVWFLISDKSNRESPIRNRYTFDHSKYLLIDGERSVIASENFGYSGHPIDPSYGNRGWMIHIRSKPFYEQLRRVWDADLSIGKSRDLVEVAQDSSDNWGFPYKHPPFALRRAIVTGGYPLRRPPLRVKGKASFELVVCPDNCLSERGALVGLINSARESLFILQNSVPLWWGKKEGGSIEATPNLPLAAVVNAARRGVRVRVLLDGTWYNRESYDPRDNDDTVRYLNALAQRENLNLEAKVVNLASTQLDKIHAKGIIADGRRTFIGSINWTENSFKANREVGVVVQHPDVATYYATLFQRDWAMTRLYRARVGAKGADVRASLVRGSAVLSKSRPGQLLDVMAEQSGVLEVRVSEKATGYVARDVVDEILATPEEADALVGRAARVVGRVRSTHPTKSGLYLNFGVNWRGDFSVFIPSATLPEFQAAGLALPAAVEGREVEVSGDLYEKDGPQMRVDRPALLKVLP